MSVVAHLYKTVNQKGRSLYDGFYSSCVFPTLSENLLSVQRTFTKRK